MRDRDSGDNVTTTAGLSAFASAMVWSGIQDQAAALGVTTPVFLTPLYGALGSGSGTASASDTQLFAELARTTVGAGAATPATPSIQALCDWLFFFPPPVTSWTVTEAGAFGLATSAANSGTMLDHYMLASAVTVSSPDSALLQVALSVAGSLPAASLQVPRQILLYQRRPQFRPLASLVKSGKLGADNFPLRPEGRFAGIRLQILNFMPDLVFVPRGIVGMIGVPPAEVVRYAHVQQAAAALAAVVEAV